MPKSKIYYKEINELLKRFDLEIQRAKDGLNKSPIYAFGIYFVNNEIGVNKDNIDSILITLRKSNILNANVSSNDKGIVFSTMGINTELIKEIKHHYNFDLESYMKDNTEKGNTINVGRDVINSQMNQDSDLRESEFHNIEKKYPTNPATTTQKESTIFQKIYNLTNHQVIGGLIVFLLAALLTWYFTKK